MPPLERLALGKEDVANVLYATLLQGEALPPEKNNVVLIAQAKPQTFWWLCTEYFKSGGSRG